MGAIKRELLSAIEGEIGSFMKHKMNIMLAYAKEGRNHLRDGYHPELCRLGNLFHVYLRMQTAKANASQP